MKELIEYVEIHNLTEEPFTFVVNQFLSDRGNPEDESSKAIFDEGYEEGYQRCGEESYSDGYDDGVSEGYDDGYNEGYSSGYDDGCDSCD